MVVLVKLPSAEQVLLMLIDNFELTQIDKDVDEWHELQASTRLRSNVFLTDTELLSLL